MTNRNRKDKMPFTAILVLGLVCIFLVLGGPSPAYSQKGQPKAAPAGPDPWPKSADVNGTQFTIYQPQLDTWDGYRFEAHAAVSVLLPGYTDPIFGVIQVTASTLVDRRSRTVPVQNEPPQFVFSQKAAVLVAIDGEPLWRPVENTPLLRVLNTRALILKDPAGRIYLRLFDGFLGAPSLSGPGGQSASAAKVGNNVYAGHDGNVYKNTGSGWEQKTGGECYPFFSKIWNHYPGKRD